MTPLSFAALFVASSSALGGGPVPAPADGRVWVFLSDKGIPDAAARARAVAGLEAEFPPRTAERRRLRRTEPGVFDERDLPVAAAYTGAIAAAGGEIHVRSRWLNAVSVKADAAALERIAALPFVRRVAPVARARGVRLAGVEGLAGGAELGPAPYHGLAEAQLAQINVVAMHDLGFAGQGVVIGVLDTGFHRAHSAFNGPEFPLTVVAEHDFINDDANTGIEPGDPDGQADHGTFILGTLAAHAPGTLVGAAYRASYILCKTEDVSDEYPAEEDNYVAGLEFAEFHGADVVTSSLGYSDWYTQADFDGQTAVTTVAVNVATANGVICCTAAGNGSHDDDPATSSLIAPADAFKVLTCGAVDDAGGSAWFTSSGPTADGRVKPEVLTRGVSTATVSVNDPSGYVAVNGTSLATPLLAGAAACLLQSRPAWTVDKMRTYLMTSASGYVADGAPDPLFVRGYGIIDAAAARAEDCNRNGVPDPSELAAGAAPDCNGNGIPDSCDIAAGTSRDADGDGVPDECTPPCPADWNGDHAVNSSDISAYLTAWLGSVQGGTLAADFNHDLVVNSTDISAMLTAWLAAVQGGC